MKTVKCEIINYRNRIWILFDDKRKVKVGDRVITPTGITLQKVIIIYNTFDMEGMCATDKTGGVSFLASALSIVAAIESEISPSDLEKVKTQQSCFVYEDDGELILKDGYILLTFEN
jgi:hypothetical protein